MTSSKRYYLLTKFTK